MSSLHGVEQLFKMRDEFKQCELPKGPKANQPSDNSGDSASKVTELIKKLKGQVEQL